MPRQHDWDDDVSLWFRREAVQMQDLHDVFHHQRQYAPAHAHPRKGGYGKRRLTVPAPQGRVRWPGQDTQSEKETPDVRERYGCGCDAPPER